MCVFYPLRRYRAKKNPVQKKKTQLIPCGGAFDWKHVLHKTTIVGGGGGDNRPCILIWIIIDWTLQNTHLAIREREWAKKCVLLYTHTERTTSHSTCERPSFIVCDVNRALSDLGRRDVSDGNENNYETTLSRPISPPPLYCPVQWFRRVFGHNNDVCVYYHIGCIRYAGHTQKYRKNKI